MSENHDPDKRPVAFFDFDGTLTTGDTLMPFLKFVVGTPTYYAKLAQVSPVLGAYFAKLLRNDIAKQIVLKQYLAGHRIDDLFERGQRFSEEVIPTMLRTEGMERLRWHQAQGHSCYILSASLDVYLNFWASQYGFDEKITSSLDASPIGVVSGKLGGANCFGYEKYLRINKLLERPGCEESYGYGDTQGDIPFLRAVKYGFMLDKSKRCFRSVK